MRATEQATCKPEKLLQISQVTALSLFIHSFTSRIYSPDNYIGPSSNIALADCMSFYCEFKTLRVGNSYDLKTQSKMSTHGEGNTGEVGTGVTEGSEESNIGLSPEIVFERIKASLEPLHAQIPALTETMDRITEGNLTTESTTPSTRGLGLHHESTYSEGLGSSKFPTIARLTTVYLYIEKCCRDFTVPFKARSITESTSRSNKHFV